MNARGTVTLETDRLVLRRFVVSDADAAYANWCSDTGISRFLSWPPHADVAVTRRIVDGWVSGYARDDFFQWAIATRDHGELIGSIGVVGSDDDIAAVEIGYCIGSRWWGNGLATEAVGRVAQYLLTEAGLNRVSARYDEANGASARVLEKCGFRFEGVQRASLRNNSGIRDAVTVALLASDLVAQ
ncbi:GNAT family N-acetyltransferase [Gulosibacter bifidus]|uniref:GNAT family N-acetyltransferase n=1 Tax=Gulosibacter bifidus TaxID=272239 RepID=A0ABW5RHN2_9MICO|nr:GNAT family N-acetyltransferase [Gulosibacter bifidus]